MCFVCFYWFLLVFMFFCSLYLITAQPFLEVTGITGGAHFVRLLGRAFSFPFIYLYHIDTPSIRQPPEQNLLRPQVSVY